MKHTLSVLVEDESGALSRIAGLFARRGFNIDSLAVGPAEAERQSRLTMVVEGDDQTLQQMTKQLDKLVNVLQVLDLTQRPAVERELLLLKVSAPAETRSAVFDLVQVFRAKSIKFWCCCLSKIHENSAPVVSCPFSFSIICVEKTNYLAASCYFLWSLVSGV